MGWKMRAPSARQRATCRSHGSGAARRRSPARNHLFGARAAADHVARLRQSAVRSAWLQSIPERPDRQYSLDPQPVRRRADGRIICSTEPMTIGLNVADRPHFQDALNSREFALSDYLINRVNQSPSVVATYPAISRRRFRQRRGHGVDQSAMDRRPRLERRPASRRLGHAARRHRHAGRRLGRSAGLIGKHFRRHRP